MGGYECQVSVELHSFLAYSNSHCCLCGRGAVTELEHLPWRLETRKSHHIIGDDDAD